MYKNSTVCSRTKLIYSIIWELHVLLGLDVRNCEFLNFSISRIQNTVERTTTVIVYV